MGEFFRGWRRKTGVVTLIAVFASMSMSVRSQTSLDVIGIGFEPFCYVSVVSRHGRVGLLLHDSKNDTGFGSIVWNSWPLKNADVGNEFTNAASAKDWHLRWIGFEFGRIQIKGKFIPAFGTTVVMFVTPYLGIALPLTLLAAYLLVSTPNKPNQMKNTESAAIEET